MASQSSAPSGRSEDDRFRVVVTWIARTSLEVERGLRPIRHLRTLVHPNDPRHARMICRLRSDIGGPVTVADLGRPSLSRIGGDHLYASIATRGADGRVRGMSMHLFRDDGHWYLADVHRLMNRRDQHVDLAPDPPDERRLGQLSETRRLVHAAEQAVRADLAELNPEHRSHQQLTDRADRFGRLAARLDQELAELRATLDLRDRLGVTGGRTR